MLLFFIKYLYNCYMKNIEQTSDYKIINIIKDFKSNFKSKNETFSLLLRLKQSIEFNSTIDWKQIYKELSDLYGNNNPYYESGSYTQDPIDSEDMSENDIFVFGSNTQGEHLGGAAKVAVNQYGAIIGQARGLQGNSYGIVTLDYTGEEIVDVYSINREIDELILFALDNQDKTFYVTKIGCGISNYEIKDIAKLFKNKIIPTNIILPYEFTIPNASEKYFLYNEESYIYIKNENTYIECNINTNKIKENKTITEGDKCILLSSINHHTTILSNESDFTEACEKVLKSMFN